MKRRKLFAPYLTHSWIVFAAGAAVWVLTVLLFRIKSVNTGDPYIFKEYGSADIVTPVIMMFMGIFSSIPYYSACLSCNVSRVRSAEPVVFTGAAFSLIYTILDIIAVKRFIPPVEGYDTVNCFFEGQQYYKQLYTFDELLETDLIIAPVLYSFIFLLSMWLCGAIIGRLFANCHKAKAIYQTAAFFVFICFLGIMENSFHLSVTSFDIYTLRYSLSLIVFLIALTDLPALISFLMCLVFYPPVHSTDNIMVNSLGASIINFPLLLIVYLLLVRRLEIYKTKKHKNGDTGGDDDA